MKLVGSTIKKLNHKKKILNKNWNPINPMKAFEVFNTQVAGHPASKNDAFTKYWNDENSDKNVKN